VTSSGLGWAIQPDLIFLKSKRISHQAIVANLLPVTGHLQMSAIMMDIMQLTSTFHYTVIDCSLCGEVPNNRLLGRCSSLANTMLAADMPVVLRVVDKQEHG
jgi:hypothetical protein